MRQVAFSAYTGGSWDAIIEACTIYPHGMDRAGVIDTVTHLDGAGRIKPDRYSKTEINDLIVVMAENGAEAYVIMWVDYTGELVQLVRD